MPDETSLAASTQQQSSVTTANPENNSHISQSFRDQKQIEAFVRSNKLLKIVEGVADQYVQTFGQTKRPEDALAALIVRLPFVYADFLSHPSELLHLVVEEPLQFADAVKYCAYGLIRDIVKQTGGASGLKGTIGIDQVHVQLRFVGLPLQTDLIFEPSRNCYRTGLSLVLGILSSLSDPARIVIQSVWFCPTGCNRNKIKSESSEAPLCSSCSRQMSEYTKLRITQNYCLLRLLPVASVQSPRTVNKIFRAITVRAKDHTYDCALKLGRRYLITGHYDYRAGAQEFQAWNLIEQQQ